MDAILESFKAGYVYYYKGKVLVCSSPAIGGGFPRFRNFPTLTKYAPNLLYYNATYIGCNVPFSNRHRKRNQPAINQFMQEHAEYFI